MDKDIHNVYILDNNEVNFYDIIKSNELVLIDFFATWCPPCEGQSDILKYGYHKIIEKYPILKIYPFNTDNDKLNISNGKIFNIKYIPTIVIVYKQKAVLMDSGVHNIEQILNTIENHINDINNNKNNKLFRFFKLKKSKIINIKNL